MLPLDQFYVQEGFGVTPESKPVIVRGSPRAPTSRPGSEVVVWESGFKLVLRPLCSFPVTLP